MVSTVVPGATPEIVRTVPETETVATPASELVAA